MDGIPSEPFAAIDGISSINGPTKALSTVVFAYVSHRIVDD